MSQNRDSQRFIKQKRDRPVSQKILNEINTNAEANLFLNGSNKKKMSLCHKKSKKSFDDSSICKICERDDGDLICKNCGHMWKGRQRIKCSTHTNTLFLMDFVFCPKCQTDDIKELEME
ncbi:unnamed protein product [Brachionus calyciflorus]|uniref:Uncharacterized protein n=1 Tax=Brachionus calyciflorus TaxID=104777 RepID=A0A813MHC6_9BILA|nr:unnamed protein product [Brachionus calyciflorus]